MRQYRPNLKDQVRQPRWSFVTNSIIGFCNPTCGMNVVRVAGSFFDGFGPLAMPYIRTKSSNLALQMSYMWFLGKRWYINKFRTLLASVNFGDS